MKTTKWALDPTHSELSFKIRHLMISNVSGSIKDFQVSAETRDDDFSTAQISVVGDMASVSTNQEQRDTHLRTADFFEVEKHPQFQFKSTRIEKAGDGTFALYGDLTLKGITKPVQLNVEFNGIAKDPWGNQKAGFLITGRINRSEWGVNFNGVLETGGVMLSDEIKINSEIQMIKQVAPVPA